MRLLVGAAAALALATTSGWAAHKPPAKPAAAKGAPSCAGIAFRPLPAGAPDGEQTAGTYHSRFAKLELRGMVQGGAVADYYVVANGSKIAPAQGLPPALSDCAAAKKMPPPGAAAASCTGEKFTLVVAHAGDKRFAALYALGGGKWSFCNAGSF